MHRKKISALLLALLLAVTPLWAYADDSSGEGGPTIGSSAQEPSTPSQEEQEQQEQQEQEYQDQLDELNDKLNDLKDQQAAIDAQINQAKNEKEKAQKQKDSIDSQIYSTQEQIRLTEEKLALLGEQLVDTQARIAAKEQDIAENDALFRQRIRTLYMQGDNNTLNYLLDSSSYTEFVMRLETARRIAAYDSALIESLQRDKADLQTEQANLQATQQEQEEARDSLDSLKANLSSQSGEMEKYISSVSEMEAAFLKDKENLQRRAQQMQDEIDAIYANLDSSGEFAGDGDWLYPVPGYTYISSGYGWRFQNSDFHTGVDFTGANVYGKNIVASAAGTVAVVQNNGSSGYGRFLIIDHGGGYSTLYAHTSAVLVSVGDVVEKGQPIAKVGNSGWVIPGPTASNPTAGSHCHFEIRINGQHTNPMDYL